jgi:hypothetical protein
MYLYMISAFEWHGNTLKPVRTSTSWYIYIYSGSLWNIKIFKILLGKRPIIKFYWFHRRLWPISVTNAWIHELCRDRDPVSPLCPSVFMGSLTLGFGSGRLTCILGEERAWGWVKRVGSEVIESVESQPETGIPMREPLGQSHRPIMYWPGVNLNQVRSIPAM